MSDFRKRLEKASAPYLSRVHALPRWVLPVFMTIILLIGLLANPNESPGLWIGFFALLFIGLFLVLVAVLIFYTAFSRF
jgi:hypothetical protein